ncbi:AsmA family protein [Hyphococcus flavus]|uniref:AsmA family protein n=1 Tax=Hyphococcus flavus TaxID=1866326 RepID=A0AAE9ZBQ4_9PROT|nr:AsmA family protein [Hyphococcus flavus]WDI30350.1 AsmA family protein [Hyphococcus flavus]
MGRILFFLVALVAVALAVLLFLPGLIPVAAFKDRIETAASNAVGREVTISDNLSFRVFPRTAFHVEELVIANAEGFEGPYLIRVEEADIGVKLIPLLSESVEIDRFVLTRPDINLARNRSGAVNWDLSTASTPEEGEAQSTGSGPRELKLGDVRIVEGAARYQDAAAGKSYAAEDINMSVVLKSLAEPLEMRGDMVFQGEPSKVDIVLTSLADIIDKQPGNLKMNLEIGDATAGADLTVNTGDALSYAGPVTLDAPDLPALAALVGTQLEDAPGFDKLAVKGDIDGGDSSLRLENADITFDEIEAQGVVNLNWAGAKPKATGVLSTERLDLRPYMPPPAESAEGFPAWSEAPMDFSSLRNMDAEFDISTDAIFVNNLEFGESRIKLTVDNGRMTAEIPELSMYGGQGSGRMVVNARGSTPSFAGNFDVGAVQAQPFTQDLMKHDNLLGLGSFKLNFEAAGASQAAIMNSVDGSGGFDLADGALKGVNIAAMVRAVGEFQDGFNPAALQRAVSEARGPSEQTDFSEFLSDFSITNGLVNAPTINLTGPYLTMTGAGTVNLAAQTIDIRLSPRGTTTMDGQGGRAVTVPVRVGGTFSQPTIGIDAESLARAGLQRTLTDVLSRNRDNEETEGEEAEEEDPASSIIKGILGGRRQQPDDGAENPDDNNGATTEETLINEGLNAIFNQRKKSADDAEQQKENPQ